MTQTLTSSQSVLARAVHDLRTRQGLSLRTLAQRAGFSASFLSQVENDLASPSIASLERLADALGVSMVTLLTPPDAAQAAVVTAAERPSPLTSTWSKARIEPLSAQRVVTTLSPLLITLEPGGRSGKSPVQRSYEEFALVISGELLLELDGEPHLLGQGDAVHLAPGVRQLWHNPTDEPAKLLTVSTGGRVSIEERVGS